MLALVTLVSIMINGLFVRCQFKRPVFVLGIATQFQTVRVGLYTLPTKFIQHAIFKLSIFVWCIFRRSMIVSYLNEIKVDARWSCVQPNLAQPA